MTLWSTQPLAEMSNFSFGGAGGGGGGGKAVDTWGWQLYHIYVPTV